MLAELASAYVDARALAYTEDYEDPTPYLFQLPGKGRPVTRDMSAWVETWRSSTPGRYSIRAPPGFLDLGHSQSCTSGN